MLLSQNLIKLRDFKSVTEFYAALKGTTQSLIFSLFLPLILAVLACHIFFRFNLEEAIPLKILNMEYLHILLFLLIILNIKRILVLLYYLYVELRICLISIDILLLRHRCKDNRETLVHGISSIEYSRLFNETMILKDALNISLHKIKAYSTGLYEAEAIEKIKAECIKINANSLNVLNQRFSSSAIFTARPKIRERIILLENALVKAKEANVRFEKLGPFSQSLYGHNDIVPVIGKDLKSLKELLKFFDKAYDKLIRFKQLKSEELVKRLELVEKYSIEKVANTVKEINYKDYEYLQYDKDDLKKSYLAMSIGCSAAFAADLYNMGQVYDALREVSGNYAGMSDAEIWFETLFMSSASLQGLENLTKGRYFENLVAEDTGGTLFENFNHPDTDILLNGQAVQLKATSNEAYINSIDDDITVIATSEVALNTGAIDSGYSNEELSEIVELSFGGILDFGDAALHGLGGLGIFASLQGLNLFFKCLDEKVEVDIAMVEGLELAFEKTVQSTAAVADIAYKVSTAKLTVNIFTFLFRATYWILAKTTNLIIAILDRIFK